MSGVAQGRDPVPAHWHSPNGEVIACVEKLKVLRENLEEIRASCQDALDDAVLAGELDGVERLPLSQAKRRVMKFPSIGEPGAEKILMLARTHTVLGLDSSPICTAERI